MCLLSETTSLAWEMMTMCYQRLPVGTGHVRTAGDSWGLGSQGFPAPVGQEGDLTNICLSHEEVKHDT